MLGSNAPPGSGAGAHSRALGKSHKNVSVPEHIEQ